MIRLAANLIITFCLRSTVNCPKS